MDIWGIVDGAESRLAATRLSNPEPDRPQTTPLQTSRHRHTLALMRRTSFAWLSLALILAGCSYHYDLRAVVLNGKIAFVPRDEKSTGCISDFNVTTETGEVVWELDAGRYLPPPCVNRFPIVYGSVPQGMVEKVPAKPLRAGMLYKVEGWDGDTYSGAFHFHEGIVIDDFATPG